MLLDYITDLLDLNMVTSASIEVNVVDVNIRMQWFSEVK